MGHIAHRHSEGCRRFERDGRLPGVLLRGLWGTANTAHRAGCECRRRSRPGFPGWLPFLSSLIARGLSVVQLVVTDAHASLVDAVGAVEPGDSWQRCRAHYARNLLSQVLKSAERWGPPSCGPSSNSPTPTRSRPKWHTCWARFPKAAAHLDAAQHDLLAFTAFLREIWRQIWSNNPQ